MVVITFAVANEDLVLCLNRLPRLSPSSLALQSAEPSGHSTPFYSSSTYFLPVEP